MEYIIQGMEGLDSRKVVTLLVGIAGIYGIYFVTGIIQQAIIKETYQHDDTGEHESFDYPQSQLLITATCSYLIALIFNSIKYPKETRHCISWQLNFKSGAMVTISTIAYSYAIKFTNFPVVMMIRSCNILSVVLVGVLFTGVKDATLKLGKRKIVMATLATAGMIIFKVFDPNSADATYTTQTLGIVLMIVSLIADGFLPDFQAMIKSIHKPPAIVMLQGVNQAAMLLCFTFSVVTGHIVPMLSFIISHQKLMIDLLLVGFLSAFGQFFVYYLTMVFRQHIVPLIVGTRKIFTVGLSIIYFNHAISPMQLIGLIVVFAISISEFRSESASSNVENNANEKSPTSTASTISDRGDKNVGNGVKGVKKQ